MKGFLTSKAGVVGACLFAVVMAIVIQRVLSRQAERRIAPAAAADAGRVEQRTAAPTASPASPAAERAAGPSQPAAALAKATAKDVAYLDTFQKSGAKSRTDKDRQGRTVTRRRTASAPNRAGGDAGDRLEDAAPPGALRLQGRAPRKGETAPARPGEVTDAPIAAAAEPGASAQKQAGGESGRGDPAGPLRFVPYGHPIKCELVFTIDSTLDESPVIALVMEPVYNNGEQVLPAGAELHGVVRPDRLRDRLFSAREWVLVLPREAGAANGRELPVVGLALDRAEPEASGLTWGITDGSLGLQGMVIRTMDFEELKRFAATFVSAAALALQEREGAGRGTTRVASTPRNAALQGLASSLEDVARKIADEVARNGVFLRVPGGKQFYFYPQRAIVPADAALPRGRAEPSPPKTS